MNYRVNTDHCINEAHWFDRLWFLRVTRRSFLLSCSITSLTFLNDEEKVEVEAAITTSWKVERDGA